MKDLKDYSLLRHNTFGIDARCDRFVEFASVDELRQVLAGLEGDYLLLGEGSNLLLTGDYHGTVVTPEPRFDVCREGNRLRCWAGTTWDNVVAYAVEQGLFGLENLSFIPGQVGASAIQNIGAYGVEAKDVICRVEAVEISTGAERIFVPEECAYSYRQSRFKQEWKDQFVITYVTYELSTDYQPHLDYGNIRQQLEAKHIENPTPQQLRDTIIEIRKAKLPDPAEQGNAGSFFMNPIVPTETYRALCAHYPSMPHYTIDASHEKIPAGWMIEQCGWKGRSLGRAGVHDKQALVLVNRGGATGAEIMYLCNTIRKDVKGKFGIDIYPEVNIR